MSATLKNISLYVPFIFEHFDHAYVTNVFRPYGDIDLVELVPSRNRNGKNGSTVYVHFKRWYNTKEAVAFHTKISKNGNTKLSHDAKDHYEWLVLKKDTNRVVPGERKKRINLDLEDSTPATGLSEKPEEAVKQTEVTPEDVNAVTKPKTISYAQVAVKPTMLPTPLLKAKLTATKKASMSEHKPEPVVAPVSESAHVAKPVEPVAESYVPYVEDQEQVEKEMEEMDEFLDEEDEHVIAIDGRYVHYLEQDNLALSEEVARLRAALLSVSNLMLAKSQEMVPVMPPPMETM